ncbi:hypothetical protein C8Q79DRAFT_909764 [Trametes meyenii]|nr:hypothetical protein C8Q79DRAFT_909764 [Trametes meyenii]
MPSRILDQRNVAVGDYYGNVLAGFHQYGSVSWKTFFSWLVVLLDTADPWIVIKGDRLSSEQYFPSSALVMPGRYTLLTPGRQPPPASTHLTPLRVKLTPVHARGRQSIPARARHASLNLNSTKVRDRKCMIPGEGISWCKLQSAHLFSGAHPTEVRWKPKGRPASPAAPVRPALSTAGSRCGSLQNMLLLRGDLHDAWAEYEFGIDPDDGYRITAFVAGHDSIVGRDLQLDHISDPTVGPLDQLLRDHFLQGLLKHVKGRGERHWDFGAGALDLSDMDVWGTEEGKERLEVELENRLSEHRLKQEGPVPSGLPVSVR